MFLLTLTLSLVFGLYFARNNLVISILVSVVYLLFVLWRFGRKKFIVFVLFFGIGILIPRIPLPSKNGPDYGGIVIESRDNYYIFQSGFQKYYVYSSDNNFEIGDRLTLSGTVENLKITTYESRFNFKDYLKNKGIDKQLVVTSTKVEWQSFIKIHQFKRKYLSNYDENTATLISAFLFNDKDYSSNIITIAQRNSLLFLFTLSGTYLYVLFAISNYLLQIKFSKKTSSILTFIIFLPLAFFSFTKIGTLRVFGLYLLKYVNKFCLKKKNFVHIELVSILALIFLSVDYHLVYQETFYIGFLLSLLAPFLLNAIKFANKRNRKFLSFGLMYGILLPLRVSDSYWSPLTLLGYLLSLPISLLFLFSSIVSILLPFKKPTAFIGKGLIWILEKMDAISIRIPFGNWGGMFVYLFLGVFMVLIYLLESVRLKHAKMVLLGLFALIAGSVIPLQEPLSNCVYFVNVGQGDSIIIKNKTHTVMIDTGGNKSFDMAEEVLIPFMNKKKITHLDALILTHDDFDHSGAKDSLIENFKVGSLLTKQNQFPYKIGDLTINNLNTFSFEEENDKSLVLSLDFIGKKFLFTGDASVKTEEKILSKYDVDCDILKIGHHGSNTSTSEKFLKAASPSEAIISCGEVNSYGHPNKEIIDRLEKYNVKIRRTSEEGTICYFSLKA